MLTLALWGAGIEPVEVPINYRRRQNGRSFVRYPEYFARVVPAVWREFHQARKQRATSPTPSTPATTNGARAPVEQREHVLERVPMARPAARDQPAAAPAHVGVEPDRRGDADGRQRGARLRQSPHPPGDERDGQQQPGQQMPAREPEAEHRGREERGDEELRAERERADERGGLSARMLRDGSRELLAPRAHEHPHADAGEQEHGRPPQQPELAVDHERDEPVRAFR